MRAEPSSDAAPDVCFVCLESSPPLLNVCDCKTRYVHLGCQKRLLDVPSHEGGICPVCSKRYSNLDDKPRFVEPSYILAACMLSIPFVILFSASWWMFALWMVQGYAVAHVYFFMLLCLSGFVFSVCAASLREWPTLRIEPDVTRSSTPER